MSRWQAPEALTIPGDALCRAEILLDFGAEIEGELEVTLDAPRAMNVFATFGESEAEAAGLGRYGQGNWTQAWDWFVESAGVFTHRFLLTGFRFVRLQFHDLDSPARLLRVVVIASFTGEKQKGDLICEDKILQRLWQTSAYTARLCTRPDDFWDGIKRDRHGWFGDARITAMAWAATFFDPAPVSGMLARLPEDEWANGIPNFSFDGVAMLADQIRVYGLDVPLRDENWNRVKKFLDWVDRTQTNGLGFIHKTTAALFFDHGFLDWSSMPVGGRPEDLSWLQCKHLEALRSAAQIGEWLGDLEPAQRYAARANSLARRIVETFQAPGGGLHHTLQTLRPGCEKYGTGWAAPADGPPSGASRHSIACAVFAGLEAVAKGDIGDQPPVITPMFLYYEMEARARLGDPEGAITTMRNWLADMVLPHDGTTIWESFEPEVKDFRKWGLGLFPKSLCHGWGAGLVPLVQRWLLGLEILAPGCTKIRRHKPVFDLPLRATVPTPHGNIEIENGIVNLPNGVKEAK